MRSPTLISDPAVTAIPAVDCGEPLADVRERPTLRLDHRKADPQGAFAKLRAGILDRLVLAQGRLPAGVHLLIVEGYRPMALQQGYFEEYAAHLQQLHPQHSAADIAQLASRYISPPRVAPHPAGAAVDLTLCTADGDELDLGTPVNASPEESDGACYFAAPQVVGPARTNRDLIATALSGVGLVNYPTEWWHWSYGDRYWAFVTRAERAVYDVVESRTVER
ncbi:MAG: M15 family metallopeptidase [Mycobacteriales bacterium]